MFVLTPTSKDLLRRIKEIIGKKNKVIIERALKTYLYVLLYKKYPKEDN